jgi:hypothetical protein
MKKGQVNPNPQSYVSLLIFIIGVAILLYILMLPPADRAELLEQNRTEPGDGVNPIRDQITVIMTQEPGTLSNIPETEIIEDLPSFNLFSRTDAIVIEEFDSLTLRKSLFDEQFRNITFQVENPENTDNIMLSFNTPKNQGILTIYLNGQVIHSNDIETASPPALQLSKDLLRESNILEFEISGPGIQFWKTNEYFVTNIKITGDFTDTSSREVKQVLYVTEQEKQNLESMELSFIVECKSFEVSPLEIYLNKRLIYSAVPDCDYGVQVPEVDGRRLVQGENTLLFKADEGHYFIYSVESVLNLKKPLFPTYYFFLNEEMFEDIDEDIVDLNVTVLFSNAEDLKKGAIMVNGIRTEIYTRDDYINRKINNYIRSGNNALEIRPEDHELNIIELQVLHAE